MNANNVTNTDQQHHFGYILKHFHTKLEEALEA